MKVLLLRHGKTVWNQQKRMQGQKDSPLLEEGKEQLFSLADRLKSLSVDAVYASPLKRAWHTAEILFPGKNIIEAESLKEIALGDWEGRSYAAVHERMLPDHENFWEKPHLFQARPGGESIEDVQKRACSWLSSLIQKHHDNEILALVSHTVVIKSILLYYEERPLETFWQPPAVFPGSFSQLSFEGGAFRAIDAYGDISHYSRGNAVTGRI